MKVKAVVFDMDGLIFDSEVIYKYAWQAAGKEMGVPIGDELYFNFIGLSTESCEKILIREFGADFPLSKFRQLWTNLRRDKIRKDGVPFKPGFETLFQYLKKKNVALALATSSPMEDVELNFKNLNYLSNFTSIMTEAEVSQGKPHPEIYLRTASRLGLNPAELLVLEDSNNGMKAAIAAGTMAVMVPDMLPPEPEVKKSAYKIVKSLQEVIELPVLQNNHNESQVS